MNTTQTFRQATLCAASLLSILPAHAAPHLDPKIIGHWGAGLPLKPGGPSPILFTFRPTGTVTQEVHGRGINIILLAACTTHSGLLTETLIKATSNGKPLSSSAPSLYRYTVTPAALTLTDTKRPWHITLHRITP